ncbi:helicase associated domain-containing protein [Nocardia cyriacigeorgica]|nr:helicase associated domain-containing protein [Nocardia cyriacigeorgica]
MHRYNLRRTISFHSRVNRAREFAADLPAVIDWMPPDQRPVGKLWAAHASGDMSTGKRRALLRKLSDLDDCDRALMTNARCLNEGIDVPALDGVAFIDPRQSEVDIVQAVGRAIRLADDKTLGTIVIPVFVDSEHDPETVLNESSFKPVWDVLQALRSHDAALGETLDHLRHELSTRSRPGSIRLPDKIVVDLPTTVPREFAEAFNVRLVEKTTSTWEFWLGLLELFVEQEGHALVPATYKTDGHALGSWVATQRHKYVKGRLDAARVQRLDAVPGWIWDALTAQWEEGHARLVTFVDEHGHAQVPQSFTADDYKLGTWVTIQRSNHAAGRGLPDREARLESLPGWSWNPRSDQWESTFEHLVKFAEDRGHTRVPKDYTVDRCGLGGWVQIQRSRYNRRVLDPVRANRLQALPGWTWTPDADRWNKFFALLVAYVEKHGHPRVPQSHVVDGHRLGSWLSNQRQILAKGSMPDDRAERLTALPGWTAADPWEDWYTLLVKYADEHGHSRVPRNYAVGVHRLGSWVAKQRDKHSAATLSAEKVERLSNLPGWSWDPHADVWEMNFSLLKAYVQANGHARVPSSYTVNSHRLGQWVGLQRATFSRGRLDPNRAARLEALPMWSWDPLGDQWEEGFTRLTAFVREHQHAQVPKSYFDETGFALGSWVGTQRTRRGKDTLSVEQQRRLSELPGWIWDARVDQWEQGFRQLADYVDRHGDARVPSGHVDDTGYRLGQWCKVQRRNRELSTERRRRLDSLPGWTWDAVADQWEQGFRHLTAYVGQHGHARVPDAFESEDEFRLGQWVGVQRRAQSTGNLSAARQLRLTALPGWTWNPLADQWEDGFAALASFVEQHGHARVPREFLVGNLRLGQWVLTQRSRYAKGRMPDKQVKRLEDLTGWSWDTLADQWEEGLAHFVDYVTENGQALVPQDHVDQGGFRLGTWVATQRSRYAKGTLDPARVRRIEQSVPGWSWDPYTDRWEQGFAHLVTYVEKHGHARVPRAYEVDGYRLGGWCKTQRSAHAKGSLSTERFERLNSLTGWTWDANAESWEEGLAQLIAFVDQHGHARIPRDCIVDGYTLGNWASNQRAARARGALSADRVKRIEEAVPGWSWTALSDRWDEGFARLLAYTAEHGHALVPQLHVDKTGFRLGTWVATQRTRYTSNSLSTDRIERLESVDGWAWNPHVYQWESGFSRLVAYVDQHGHACVPQSYIDESGFRLGVWVLTQRRRKIKGAISDEQVERLEGLPDWTWNAKQ